MQTKSISNEEVRVLRSHAKGCAKLIHFNNAGASLPPDVVVETIVDYLHEEALCGGYETERKYAQRIDEVYSLVAQLINAGKDEIALFENARGAWGSAFRGLAFNEGDEIITCELEYMANLMAMMDMQKMKGIRVKVISNDGQGNFPLNELEAAITPNTKLIAVTHISSSGGGMLPVLEIGKIANAHQILYMVDACQSAGQVPLDVQQIGCDILTATGRKYLRGPRGTAFLYVRRPVLDKLSPVLLDHYGTVDVTLNGYTLRNDAKRFELNEKSFALVLGLGKAIEYALNIGVEKIGQRTRYLAGIARQQLGSIPNVTVHDTGNEKCGIVTFSVEGIQSETVANKLAALGINVSVASALATLIYMEKHNLKSIVRASVHYYNTEDEINKMCKGVLIIISSNANTHI